MSPPRAQCHFNLITCFVISSLSATNMFSSGISSHQCLSFLFIYFIYVYESRRNRLHSSVPVAAISLGIKRETRGGRNADGNVCVYTHLQPRHCVSLSDVFLQTCVVTAPGEWISRKPFPRLRFSPNPRFKILCANCIQSLSFCGMLGVSPLQEQILRLSTRALVCVSAEKHCSSCSSVSPSVAVPWLVIKCSRTCSVHVCHKHMQ